MSEIKKPYIGTQISFYALYEYGVTRVLDKLQESCGVNTVRLHADDRVAKTSHFYRRESEEPAFNLCGIPLDPKNYKDTAVMCQPYMAAVPAEKRMSILHELRRELDARGMDLQVRSIIGPDAKRDSFSACLAIDADGVIGNGPCWNNPDFRGFQRGIAEDLFRTSPVKVDGYLHMAEFSSPLHAIIYGGHMATVCFCPYCRQRAAEEGIDPLGAIAGYRELKRRVALAINGEKPLGFDGLFKVLGDYPDLMAWNNMQMRAYHECPASVKGIARHCQPDATVGIHVWHAVWTSSFMNAHYYEGALGYCDYLKPLMYHTFTGLRFSGHVKKFHKLFMPDATPDQAWAAFLQTRGMDPAIQTPWEEFADQGEIRAADYVKATMKDIQGRLERKIPLIANVGWEDEWADDAPAPEETQTYAATRAAIDQGAEGIFLCRQFSSDQAFGDATEKVTMAEASQGGSKIKTDGDVGPRGLAAYGAALRDAGWIS